jgi:hypothetical protein
MEAAVAEMAATARSSAAARPAESVSAATSTTRGRCPPLPAAALDTAESAVPSADPAAMAGTGVGDRSARPGAADTAVEPPETRLARATEGQRSAAVAPSSPLLDAGVGWGIVPDPDRSGDCWNSCLSDRTLRESVLSAVPGWQTSRQLSRTHSVKRYQLRVPTRGNTNV